MVLFKRPRFRLTSLPTSRSNCGQTDPDQIEHRPTSHENQEAKSHFDPLFLACNLTILSPRSLPGRLGSRRVGY